MVEQKPSRAPPPDHWNAVARLSTKEAMRDKLAGVTRAPPNSHSACQKSGLRGQLVRTKRGSAAHENPVASGTTKWKPLAQAPRTWSVRQRATPAEDTASGPWA